MSVYRKRTTKENKRKKVVKGKSLSGNSKFKAVTNKKTGITTTKTKTKASGSTKSSKTTTSVKTPKGLGDAQAMVSKTAKGIMPMLRKLVPDSPMAKQAMKAIKMPAPMAKRVKMAKRAKMAKKK
jgi:hypothetical protein